MIKITKKCWQKDHNLKRWKEGQNKQHKPVVAYLSVVPVSAVRSVPTAWLSVVFCIFSVTIEFPFWFSEVNGILWSQSSSVFSIWLFEFEFISLRCVLCVSTPAMKWCVTKTTTRSSNSSLTLYFLCSVAIVASFARGNALLKTPHSVFFGSFAMQLWTWLCNFSALHLCC